MRYPPLRYYLERVLRDMGGISHWAAKGTSDSLFILLFMGGEGEQELEGGQSRGVLSDGLRRYGLAILKT